MLALISLGIAAWALTGPREAQEIKARLTVDGLASALFESAERQEKAVQSVDMLYGEHAEGKETGEEGGGD